jgi:hypothetical protein
MENPVPIDHLEEKEGTRCIFTGECVRNEIDYGYLSVNEMLLLKDIKDETGQIVTDYQWFNMAKGFTNANLFPGDVVEFSGKVKKTHWVRRSSLMGRIVPLKTTLK